LYKAIPTQGGGWMKQREVCFDRRFGIAPFRHVEDSTPFHNHSKVPTPKKN
jgi:hypothetical protein